MISPFFMFLFIGTFCVFYPVPLYDASDKQIIDVTYTPIPEEVSRIFDRTISYFLWDCVALLISNEADKPLFIAHHLLSVTNLWVSRYFGFNWYLICMGLFLAEITNPLTQVSEFLEITNVQNIAFETVSYLHNIYYHYVLIRDMTYLYQLNLLFCFISMNLITICSVTWLQKKYLVIYKNNNDKKMS